MEKMILVIEGQNKMCEELWRYWIKYYHEIQLVQWSSAGAEAEKGKERWLTDKLDSTLASVAGLSADVLYDSVSIRLYAEHIHD